MSNTEDSLLAISVFNGSVQRNLRISDISKGIEPAQLLARYSIRASMGDLAAYWDNAIVERIKTKPMPSNLDYSEARSLVAE